MQRNTLIGAGLIAAGFFLSGLALAEDKAAKPDYTLHTKLLDASATVDASLKRFPGLYENLLAEGKRQAGKWQAEAEKDKKEYPEIFRDNRRQEYERSYGESSVVAGRYVSVVRIDYMDAGGAHPNRATNTILWDAKAKKRISIRPFFKETADNGPTLTALAKAIRAALAVEKRARDIQVADPDTDHDLSAVKPNLLAIGAVELAPSTEAGKSSGLIVNFSPYAVGPYVEGSYGVFVPWGIFQPYLSPEGLAIFGGERPKDGDKSDEKG
jgi:hypothetical protein